MDVLTCVYPQVDLEVMGGAERLATVGAILGGRALAALTVLGQSRLNAPRCFARVLPNIWSTHEEGETNGRCVECHFKPALAHRDNMLFFSFPSPSCLSLIVPPSPQLKTCERRTKLNASNGLTGCFVPPPPDRTLTVHKLFFRHTTVLRYVPTLQLRHPEKAPTPLLSPPVFLFSFLFIPPIILTPIKRTPGCRGKKINNAKRDRKKAEEKKKTEGDRFGYVSIAGSPRIYSCDLILTGSCQRYDRVITALTPPSAASSARHKNDDAQSSETAVCYQHNHPHEYESKMTDDNLGMC